MGRPTSINRSQLFFYSAGLLALLAFSGWKPYDATTSAMMEVASSLAVGGGVFLGTQKDKLWAWTSAVVAQWALVRWHDRQLDALKRASLR